MGIADHAPESSGELQEQQISTDVHAPQSRFADLSGVRLHYLVAGQGDPVVLLHGYTQTSHMWRPLMAALAKTHTVIAPDLRGAGQSSTPADGYTKAAMAQDIHALVRRLGHERIRLAGHDIGLMVAYAYAAQYPREVERMALMDAFLPGVGNWRDVWLLRDLWHFHFYGETPLALVDGRERIYFEHFWNDFAADRTRSVPEGDRRLYTAAYARPGGMRAGFENFRAFERDAQDFARFAQTPLPMPMLVLTGERASGEFLIQQGRLVATHVEGVIVGRQELAAASRSTTLVAVGGATLVAPSPAVARHDSLDSQSVSLLPPCLYRLLSQA